MLATLHIPKYNLAEVIHQGVNTVVYRGTSQTSGAVILKVLKSPTVEAVASIKYEYSIANNLEHENIVKILKLELHDKHPALVLEDFGGLSLKQFLSTQKQKLSISDFLNIAVQLAQALVYVHTRGIIHRDIKGANIIINPQTRVVKLIDFSIALITDALASQLQNGNLITLGTPAYMSPEQTGRMNARVDYRSDFYSLGVTFYEMLTGQLPYTTNDISELIYCHIASEAPPIKQLNPEIPDSIALIVAKLMAKNPVDRYQSAKGLLADLVYLQCNQELFSSRLEIIDFIPGVLDTKSQLRIPQKLYGREKQVDIILKSFERVNKGNCELILVTGEEGSGKSSLISELSKIITAQYSYFLSGKFDKFTSDIPYSSLIQALTNLIGQLLTKHATQIAEIKYKILEAIGSNGQVIIDIIPQVKLIIGKQPEIAELPPTESQNRLNRILYQFIKVFCSKEHPLVLFLDDLHWVDSATLKLLQLLICDNDTKYLLFIGAYRDSEVNSSHILAQTTEQIEAFDINISKIVLHSLTINNVVELVADALNSDKEYCQALAETLFHKTDGNPFLLTQLLQSLYQEKLLLFDFVSKSWQWQLEDIQTYAISNNDIVELVISKIAKLPEYTQKILQLAASLRNIFTLDVLCIISKKKPRQIIDELYPALQAGLILPSNEYLSTDYSLNNFSQEDLETIYTHTENISYKFLHNRVQQEVYSLIPDNEKQAIHFKIGLLLRQSINNEKLADNILDIVHHLNYGINLITQQHDKLELAQLNLIAGKKAKFKAAYEIANKYLNIGLSLLAKDSWQTSYDLTLNLYVEYSENLYLTGNFEHSKELCELILQNANSVLDKVKVYQILIQSHTVQNLLQPAIDIGVQALNILGVKLPPKPKIINVLTAVLQTKLIFFSTKIEDLANSPEMTDSHKLAAMQILMLIAAAASQAGSLYFPLTVNTLVRLSVKYGNSKQAALAYGFYAAILCDKLGDIETGYRFGQLGLTLLEKMNTVELKCKVNFLFNATVRHFKAPVKDTIDSLNESIQVGLDTGDIEFTSYCSTSLSCHLIFSGLNLELVDNNLLNCLAIMRKLKLYPIIAIINIVRQTSLNLQGLSSSKYILTGDAFDETEMLPLLGDNYSWLSAFYSFKTLLYYLFSDYIQAINTASIVVKYQENNPAFLMYQVNNFYYSLALLAQYNSASPREQQQYKQQVAVNQKKMKLWAYHAPCNFQHKYDLVEAEKARVLNKNILAADLYDKAIAGARANNYTHEVAIASELAAQFYFSQKKNTIGAAYISEAYYAYISWGAMAKVKDLEERYPHLLIKTSQATSLDISVNNPSKTYTKSLSIDASTVVKASQALSSEILLSNLLEKLMHLVKENAGAQKVFFITKKDNELVIEASLTEQVSVTVLQSVPITKHSCLAISIINYVERTQTHVVLDDASKAETFNFDPYILLNQPKSILVSPIIHSCKLIGILYLENNLTTNAFTKDKLEVLQILSVQAAISLENANFYTTLEARVHERTQQIEEKNKQLQATLSELRRTQSQLIHSEKMSSLGQLVAGVAHEINNPINFIYANLAHTSEYAQSLLELLLLYQEELPNATQKIINKTSEIDIDFIKTDMPMLLNSMNMGALRIRDIVKSLRNFSRLDEADCKEVDIHEGIESSLMILQQKLAQIQVIKKYGNINGVKCYASQLNQVFLHLLSNAIDAVKDTSLHKITKPTICIRTKLGADNQVVICISDNGTGMDDEVRSKIFDPFFTTKPVGQGTGLGLSISYQIITEKHQGALECISLLGKGTTFVIRIPQK